MYCTAMSRSDYCTEDIWVPSTSKHLHISKTGTSVVSTFHTNFAHARTKMFYTVAYINCFVFPPKHFPNNGLPIKIRNIACLKYEILKNAKFYKDVLNKKYITCVRYTSYKFQDINNLMLRFVINRMLPISYSTISNIRLLITIFLLVL